MDGGKWWGQRSGINSDSKGGDDSSLAGRVGEGAGGIEDKNNEYKKITKKCKERRQAKGEEWEREGGGECSEVISALVMVMVIVVSQ